MEERAAKLCPECGDKLSKLQTLRDHIMEFHLDGPKFFCNICEDYFRSPHSVQCHRRLSHPHSKNVIVNCCSYSDAQVIQKILDKVDTSLQLEVPAPTRSELSPLYCKVCKKLIGRNVLLINYGTIHEKHAEEAHLKKSKTDDGDLESWMDKCF
jgi:hypothetical protein